MQLPFVVKLLQILNEKEDILEALRRLTEPIGKIVADPGSVYGDAEEAIILKHRPFHPDTGFLPMVNRLIVLNDELVRYNDREDKTSIRDRKGIDMGRNLTQCGEEVHRIYAQMMALVEKEQHYLEGWFKPTLEGISKRENPKRDWILHLSHFKNLLALIEADLQYFEVLTHRLEQAGYLEFLKEQVEQKVAVEQATQALEVLKKQENILKKLIRRLSDFLGRKNIRESVRVKLKAALNEAASLLAELGRAKDACDKARDKDTVRIAEKQVKRKSRFSRLWWWLRGHPRERKGFLGHLTTIVRRRILTITVAATTLLAAEGIIGPGNRYEENVPFRVEEQKKVAELKNIIPRSQWGAREMKNIEGQTVYKDPLEQVYQNILIHHAAGDYGSPLAIQVDEMDRMGFDDIGYHFIIGLDGRLYQGRDIKYMGSHAGQSKEANEEAKLARENVDLTDEERKRAIDEARKKDPDYGSIGIVIDGNYNQRELTEAQQETLRELLTYLKEKYDIPNANIIGHKEVKWYIVERRRLTFEGKETVCPGTNIMRVLGMMIAALPPDTEPASRKVEQEQENLGLFDEGTQAWKDHNIEQLFALGANFYDRKVNLEDPTDTEFSNFDNLISGDPNVVEQRLGNDFGADFKKQFTGKYFYPKVVNLKAHKAIFGYRNRGEYKGNIENTYGIIVPLAQPLKTYTQLKLVPGVHENTTIVGVDVKTGKILIGGLKEFADNPDAMLSRTTRNEIKEIPTDSLGNVVARVPKNKANAGIGYSHPETITATGDIGSLPILFKGPNGRNKLGSAMGGSFIFESFDKKRLILVSGTCNQVAKAFKLFKGTDPFVTVYNIDNGTYALGFQTYDHTLRENELRRYDVGNASGGHGLYLRIVE